MQLPVELELAKLAQALNEKKASAACVSCASNNWTLVPQAALVAQWSKVLPAPGIPVSVAICNNCGFVRMHALGPLGLLPADATPTGGEHGKS